MCSSDHPHRRASLLAFASALAIVGCGGGGSSEDTVACVKQPVTPLLVCYDPTGSDGSTAGETAATGSSGSESTGAADSTGVADSTGAAESSGSSGSSGLASTDESSSSSSSEDSSSSAASEESSASASTEGSSDGSGAGSGSTTDGTLCDEFLNGPPDMPADEWGGPYEIDGQCCFYSMGGPATSSASGGGEGTSDPTADGGSC